MKILLLAFLICSASISKAQLSTKSIFERTIDRIETLKSASYTIGSINGNMFSKDDITKRREQVTVLFNNGAIHYKIREVSDDKGNQLFREIYTDGKSYTFDMNDSTYAINETKRATDELQDFSRLLKENLDKNPSKIIRKADTIYQNTACYSFFIKTEDTVSNGQHDFMHKYLLIDKKNFLPLNLKQKAEGTASKGGHIIGRVFINNESIYSNVKVDPKIVVNPISLKDFHLKNTEMLSLGAHSPQLKVKTLAGENIDENLFKGKVLLVVFGSIDCPANPLANPVLNRLYTKYKDANVAILDIFTSEKPEQLKKYMESNKLFFPAYLASRKQHSDFKIISTPNFYVIGTDRKIKFAIEGYSEKWESNLIKSIDEQLAKKRIMGIFLKTKLNGE